MKNIIISILLIITFTNTFAQSIVQKRDTIKGFVVSYYGSHLSGHSISIHELNTGLTNSVTLNDYMEMQNMRGTLSNLTTAPSSEISIDRIKTILYHAISPEKWNEKNKIALNMVVSLSGRIDYLSIIQSKQNTPLSSEDYLNIYNALIGKQVFATWAEKRPYAHFNLFFNYSQIAEKGYKEKSIED